MAAVAARNGVARVRSLLDAGHSRHRLDRAVRAGKLRRVRRGWVAHATADRFLVAAARDGVVLTCVTQARRLGLWVLNEDQAHVAAPRHAGHVTAGGAVIHWHAPTVPRHPDDLCDPIENVLVAVSRCLPHEQALAVWESALRQGAVSRTALARLDLPPAARRLCDEASPFPDSGLETLLPTRLRWLRLPMTPQAWILGRPVDLLIGERLVIQIDGGHHVGAQRAADIAHDALLMLHGYHVIRVTYHQVVNEWIAVQELISRAVAQELHAAQD